MKLTINLATRRYINLRQLDGLLLLGFALVIGLAVFKVADLAHNAAEISRIRSLSQGTGTKTGGPQVSEAQLKAQAKRIAFANAAIDKKTVNWLSLLDRLEEVVPPGVTLTQIEPDRSQTVKIGGMVRNFASLRALLENMERSKNFSEVYLLSQKESKVGQTQEGIGFQISARVALQ